MVKIFQLVTVFILLMLVVTWFFRSRDFAFREYIFSHRARYPLSPDISRRLLSVVVTPRVGERTAEVEGAQRAPNLIDEETGLIFRCGPDEAGTLEIVRRETGDIMQSLAVPTGITMLALDPEDKKLYIESEGLIYVFTPLGARG
jgi:hypothetical protein